MKKISKIISALALTSIAFASCTKEPEMVPETFTASFKVEVSELTTKATLTTDDESVFHAAWEPNEEMTVTIADNDYTAKWNAEAKSFTIENLPLDLKGTTVTANATYPKVAPGAGTRTQTGKVYNSAYDTMVGSGEIKLSDEGTAVIPMTRQTAILYFHLTGGAAGDDLVSSTLTIGDQIINTTYTEQTSDDAVLWFNVAPVENQPISLNIVSQKNTVSISRKTGATYAAGEVYVVVGKASWKPNNLLFYESFDKTTGTGGNDGKWNGTIASNNIIYDNTDWSVSNAGGAYQCVKLGSGSKKGTATTPSITVNGDACTLTFKAAAWDASSEATTLTISATNCDISKTSVTLVKGEWSDYTIALSNIKDPITITFAALNTSNNRFFLDEVKIVTDESTTSQKELLSIEVSGTPNKLNYYVDESLDPAGLVVTGTFDDGSQETISNGIQWTMDPEVLTEGTVSCIVRAKVRDITSDAYPVTGLKVEKRKDPVTFTFGAGKDITSNDGATKNGITITATDGTSTVNNWSGATYVRLQAGGTLVITPSGVKITKIVMNCTSGYEKTWSSSVGNAPTTDTTKHTVTWSGSSSEAITLTNTDGAQSRISSITVTYE